MPFELTPNERFLVGTELRDGILVLRPTLVRRLMPVPSVLFAAVVGAVLLARSVASGNRGAVFVACVVGALLVAVTGWLAIVFMLSRVKASPSGLEVRDRWRRDQWSWDEIERVGVQDAWPAPMRASPSFVLTWRAWPGESTPVLCLRNRTIVHLWVLSSVTRADSFSLGLPTPAEIHAGVLARYRGLATSQPATYSPAPPTR